MQCYFVPRAGEGPKKNLQHGGLNAEISAKRFEKTFEKYSEEKVSRLRCSGSEVGSTTGQTISKNKEGGKRIPLSGVGQSTARSEHRSGRTSGAISHAGTADRIG